MYPTVVILLVETQCFMADVCEISPSNASKVAGPVGSEAHPATLGHLSFAVEPVHGTMDSKAGSQHSSANPDFVTGTTGCYVTLCRLSPI